jgi:hypothetical protein
LLFINRKQINTREALKYLGADIENVLVVFEDYFWNEYNFKSIFDLKKLTLRKNSRTKGYFMSLVQEQLPI